MTKPAESFLTRTLRENPWGIKVARILAASLAAVDPAAAIGRALQRSGNILSVAGQEINLDDFMDVHILAIGKAGIPMAVAASDLVSDRFSRGAILSKSLDPGIPDRYQDKIRLYQGDHPIPDQNSLTSTKEILSLYSSLTNNDLVIVLISGGGSALFTSPALGISLKDLQLANHLFLNHGLNIQEINTIRKHLSQIKGGQLAGQLYPARTITMILSDVIGDPIDMIASGPTVPDPSTFQDVMNVIEKYQLGDFLPLPVIKHLREGVTGKIPETPKPNDPIFQEQIVDVIAGNLDGIMGGLQQARTEGFEDRSLPIVLDGEARSLGQKLAELLLETSMEIKSLPSCQIAGGESTVTLTGIKTPGKGGRNLETALSAVKVLANRKNIALITLATDGEDGVTDAAGAVVTGETLSRATQLGLDPDEYLKNHDSYTFFKVLDDLLLPGPTGTNVNDLCFLFNF